MTGDKTESVTRHYRGLEPDLADLFGARQVELNEHSVKVDGRAYPVVNDIIVTLPPENWPPRIRQLLGNPSAERGSLTGPFAAEIQSSFGDEWSRFPEILEEHHSEFEWYFDLVDLAGLQESRVCDMGCGNGRWSYFVARWCRQIVLVDFSDAILVARENLRGVDNAVFVLGDILSVPLRDDCCDFFFCIGVLMTLPLEGLDGARALSRLGPRALFYLYYDLENRPWYFQVLFRLVDAVRRRLAQIQDTRIRFALTRVIAVFVYLPMVRLGQLADRMGGNTSKFPLAEIYSGKGVRRLRQDVYDRFFTSIEQRHSRADIMTLADTYKDITISSGLPYWHFTCVRRFPQTPSGPWDA